MTRKSLLAASAVAAVVVVASMTMLVRHLGDPLAMGRSRAEVLQAPLPSNETMTTALADAKLPINGLEVRSAEGIVIVRGRTTDAAAREQATTVLREIGVRRVANMIRLDPQHADDEIARAAERRLVAMPDLGGCRFAVSCERGILHVSGSIRADHQRELAARALRHLDGVVEIRTDLKKL